MTVGTATELPQQTGNNTTTDVDNERVYQVVTDSGDDTTSGVLNASGLPALGDPHPSSDGTFCTRRIVRQRDQLGNGGSVYHVTCVYALVSNNFPSQDGTPGDPTSWFPRYYWTIDFIEKPIDSADFLGVAEGDDLNEASGGFKRAIVNSATQPFQEVYTELEPILGLVVNRYENSYNPLTALDYIRCTNSAPVTLFGVTFDTETALLENWTAEPLYDQFGSYQDVRYVFKFDKKLHRLIVLDNGTMERDPNTNELSLIRDDSLNVVTEPVLLNGAGTKKTTALNEQHPAFYLHWRTKGQQDFTALQLPQTAL